MKSQKDRIRQAAKGKFPEQGYKDEYYGDMPKYIEQPAFIVGATWAVKNESLRLLKFIEENFIKDLGSWVNNGKGYTDEEVINCFIKGKI
jgi:hypothetical protein